MKRILSLLLVTVMVICLLAGCDLRGVQDRLWAYIAQTQEHPGVDNPCLTYELDQALLDSFYQALDESEELSVAGENMEKIEQAADQLDELYMELIDQNQIAYILYCADQKDEEASKRYLEASELCTQAETDYNAMTRRVYLSDTPVRDALFEEWTQEEIDIMLLHNEEVAQLQQRNTELTVAFHELESENIDAEMIPLYNELVANNNRIAQIYGYTDYYTYASRIQYQRDYGDSQLQVLRQYTAQYLPAACDSVTASFYEAYTQLDREEKEQLQALLGDSYDSLDVHYVQRYLEELPTSACESMTEMFTEDRAVFTQYRYAYPGAFTVWIDGQPFCYFGPHYQDSETVIHELGHYYGGRYMEPWSMPIDICEVQSQGNEWLYLCFLEKHLPPKVYSCFSDYKLMVELSNILAFVILDEFEQRIYCHEKAGELTPEDYDMLLEDVAQAYGGIQYISENILDLRAYWKQVLLESPVYYLSYAVSSCAAVDLYMMALEDLEQAQTVYCKLAEEADQEKGFTENIRDAGLSGPFEETLYQKLGKLLPKNEK